MEWEVWKRDLGLHDAVLAALCKVHQHTSNGATIPEIRAAFDDDTEIWQIVDVLWDDLGSVVEVTGDRRDDWVVYRPIEPFVASTATVPGHGRTAVARSGHAPDGEPPPPARRDLRVVE